MYEEFAQLVKTMIGPAYKLGQTFSPKNKTRIDIAENVSTHLLYKDTLFYADKKKFYFVKNNIQLFEGHVYPNEPEVSIVSEIISKPEFINLLSAVALDDIPAVNILLENEELINNIISQLN